MSGKKFFGVVFAITGIALAVYGFIEKNSFEHQFVSFFGKNDNLILYIIGGIVLTIIGILMLIGKSSK